MSGNSATTSLIWYCTAIFSTISTSCRMSTLYAGMIALTSLSSMISASKRAFRSKSWMSCAVRSVPPISSLAVSTWTFISWGVKSGVLMVLSSYLTSMDLIWPPTSANDEQMIFNAWLTALSSVPVTSTMILWVSSLSLVSSPLMIGGIDRTLSSLSRINGYLSKSSIRWA